MNAHHSDDADWIFGAWCSRRVLQLSSATDFDSLVLEKRSIKIINVNISLHWTSFQLTLTRTEPNESSNYASDTIPLVHCWTSDSHCCTVSSSSENSVVSFSRSFLASMMVCTVCQNTYLSYKMVSQISNKQLTLGWLVRYLSVSFAQCPVKVFCLPLVPANCLDCQHVCANLRHNAY